MFALFGCSQADGSVLQFSELHAVEVPASLPLSGVHARSGTIVVWSVSPPQVLVLEKRRNISIGASYGTR